MLYQLKYKLDDYVFEFIFKRAYKNSNKDIPIIYMCCYTTLFTVFPILVGGNKSPTEGREVLEDFLDSLFGSQGWGQTRSHLSNCLVTGRKH